MQKALALIIVLTLCLSSVGCRQSAVTAEESVLMAQERITGTSSLVGKTLTTEFEDEVYTWVFGESGEVRVSGGKAGEGVDGEYKQDGTEVYVWTAEMKLEGTYDGEELEVGEAQSRVLSVRWAYAATSRASWFSRSFSVTPTSKSPKPRPNRWV